VEFVFNHPSLAISTRLSDIDNRDLEILHPNGPYSGRVQSDKMPSQIPTSMRAIALPEYCKPDKYDIGTLPTPVIGNPDDVLIKVHAASINPIDVKLASGVAKLMKKDKCVYPSLLDLILQR
jgi:hypothetical protein